MATTEVLMPLMGEGVNEATVTRWLKQPGEQVAADEPLLEVSTDKVDTEIPSPASGFVKTHAVKEDQTVQVDQLLAVIVATQEELASSSPAPSASSKEAPAAKPEPQSQQATSPTTPKADSSSQHVRSSPLVRKIAKENNIDLTQVQGSGLHGRITKRDIEAFINQAPTAVPPPPKQAVSQPAPQTTPKVEQPKSSSLATTQDENGGELLDGVAVTREPMTRMRRLIADHMVESVRTSPHVTTVFEVDLHKVVSIREDSKVDFEKREGFKLTYTPFLIHAATEAIKHHPIINTSLDGYDVLWKKDINIGCAVAIDGGLIVPVIKQAGELSLLGIARRLNDLVNKARTKKLQPGDVQGGTFSITNPGGFGSLTSNPIINQPQVAILGIGSIVKKPVVIDNMIAIRPQMLISLTFDHRVIDGEGGARYLATLRDILENYQTQPY